MNLGILGAGRIAVTMAETVRKLNESGNHDVKLYAVAARDLDRAQRFAADNGVEKAYGSYEAMLADPALDFVYIATPHSHHYQHIKLCADHANTFSVKKPLRSRPGRPTMPSVMPRIRACWSQRPSGPGTSPCGRP